MSAYHLAVILTRIMSRGDLLTNLKAPNFSSEPINFAKARSGSSMTLLLEYLIPEFIRILVLLSKMLFDIGYSNCWPSRHFANAVEDHSKLVQCMRYGREYQSRAAKLTLSVDKCDCCFSLGSYLQWLLRFETDLEDAPYGYLNLALVS